MSETKTLEERRKAEFPQYERPDYHGVMKPWRVALICEWLAPYRKAKASTMLDVGCGLAETRGLGQALHFKKWRGCEVVRSCKAPDVDIIEGAHRLPYKDGEYALVLSCDVLEHILEDDVPAVLAEKHRVASKAILLGISQKPGRFHPTIKSTEWWLEKIAQNMAGRTATVIFEDRVPHIKRPYLWVDVR